MSKNEKLNKFRQQLKGTIQRVDHSIISDRAEFIKKDKEYQIYYIPGNFSNFFEELDILGEGCVGLVKKVRKISTGEHFASKMVKLKDEETVLQVIREFKNIKQLNHPNIVRVYELYVDEIKRRIYTIMELVEAKEMFEVIRKLGSYSEQIASRIFKQVLSCIRYMHEERVCHRDLKPNNILATEDGQCVKITDFNISKFGSTTKKDKFYNKNIKMWTYTGTVSFSAPEVFSEDEYDQSVDIWSAGVVLYTMLSGEEPFQAEYLQDLIYKIQNAEYQFQSEIWSSISDEAKDLIQKCLILNPKERITPDQALLHPWITGKQNTSPLTLVIFHNFENNARRLSKRVHAYQNLGLMKPVNRKISIDYSILQRSMNQQNEQDFNAESPLQIQLAQISTSFRSRKESGSNSRRSNQSQNKNASSFLEACIRNEQNIENLTLSPVIARISQIQSSVFSPPKIIQQDSEFNSDQTDNRVENSSTFSGQTQNQLSQKQLITSSKLKRIQSLQIEKQEDDKTAESTGTPSCKIIKLEQNFSRFARSQKTHKTLILHDRYKLNEEEQFLLSQNQFSEQTINQNSNSPANRTNKNSSSTFKQQSVFFSDAFAQQCEIQEDSNIEIDPPQQINQISSRKKIRNFTVNDQQNNFQFPK